MKKLIIGNDEVGRYRPDSYYLNKMFQKIMDDTFNRNERDTLLVIFRKTFHFGKREDYLSMYWFSKAVGISEDTLRVTLERLETKGFIDWHRSNGGRTKSLTKFNKFSISDYLVNDVLEKWKYEKEEKGIPLEYLEID